MSMIIHNHIDMYNLIDLLYTITFYSTILYHFMTVIVPPPRMYITIQERWVRTGTHVPFKCGPKVSEWSNTTQTQGDMPARSGNYHMFMLSQRKHTKWHKLQKHGWKGDDAFPLACLWIPVCGSSWDLQPAGWCQEVLLANLFTVGNLLNCHNVTGTYFTN